MMGILSFLRDERTVLVGLGLTTASFVCAMRFALEHYRDEAEVRPSKPKTQYITQDTEDALKRDTLETLLQHYNFSIRETALKIVAGRAVNDRAAVERLLLGITRPDYDERERCLRALAFAVEDVETYQDSLSVLNTPRGYCSLVRSLELGLDDVEHHEPLDDPLYDEYYLRDANERRCLVLVYKLVHKYGVDGLVRARFIERWLARQPWGGSGGTGKDDEQRCNCLGDRCQYGDYAAHNGGNTNGREDNGANSKTSANANANADDDDDDANARRRRNFCQYIERKRNRISDICRHLADTRAGRRALVRARLMSKSNRRLTTRPGHGAGSDHIKVVLEISMDERDPRASTFRFASAATDDDDNDDDSNGNDSDSDSDNLSPGPSSPLSPSSFTSMATTTTTTGGGGVGEEQLVPRVVADRSAEGQRLRRRHREAMVFNDGTHPPGHGDIIQREHDHDANG